MEQLLNVLLLLLAKQFATDKNVLRSLLVEEIATHLADMLLSHLLHAELASSFHYLLVPTDNPPQTHHDSAVISLALMLFPLDEEGSLCKMGHSHLNIFWSANLGGRCKLLVFYYTPTKIFLEVFSAQTVHAAELPQRNLNLLLLVILPEREFTGFADGDWWGEQVMAWWSRLSEEVSSQHLFIIWLMITLSYPQNL